MGAKSYKDRVYSCLVERIAWLTEGGWKVWRKWVPSAILVRGNTGRCGRDLGDKR